MTDRSKAATGVGAVAGGLAGGVAGAAAAGAAVGGVAGPVGAAAGALAGAAVGALAGKGVAAADPTVDPAAEEAYWRDHHAQQPYAAGTRYEDYGPAYRYGESAYGRHGGRAFDEVDEELARDWNKARGRSTLDWESARHASRDAWQRLSDASARTAASGAPRDGL
ncbi:hypothetical protein [Pseudorhodoferax soli]|uniref:Outer membrane protein with glycine zipper n=1 Tax=Pseudorhodoferax soli TaxID=545864 RepID=A0A368XMV4_9BURK|nr:hypothetical protein [Pseudorhodoferax soli]RCW69185.1 hypothetical protein DES41_10656 [Pseudorhodoferax soli]